MSLSPRSPDNELKPRRLISPLGGLGGPLGESLPGRVCVVRELRFSAATSRFVSRIRAAVGSSLSYSPDDDSISPSDSSAVSKATGFCAM